MIVDKDSLSVNWRRVTSLYMNQLESRSHLHLATLSTWRLGIALASSCDVVMTGFQALLHFTQPSIVDNSLQIFIINDANTYCY